VSKPHELSNARSRFVIRAAGPSTEIAPIAAARKPGDGHHHPRGTRPLLQLKLIATKPDRWTVDFDAWFERERKK